MKELKNGWLELSRSRLRRFLIGKDPPPDSRNPPPEPEERGADMEEIISVPIEDFLDLHTFRPSELKNLLDDYLEAACRKNFREVRIIHGKGSGVLRQRVQALLMRHALVASFHQAEEGRGGWGATIAVLRCGPADAKTSNGS